MVTSQSMLSGGERNFHLPDLNVSGKDLLIERRWRQDYYQPFLSWMEDNWWHSYLYSVVYVALVFGGRRLMETRSRFDLRKPLIVWNCILATFSIIGTLRTVPPMYRFLATDGWLASVCEPGIRVHNVTSFWGAMFIMSKVWELGDTVFIVLRKQPLIFLHWYHHITVMIYCFYTFPNELGAGRWYMTMNYVVHSVMYTYYALRAMRFRVPKFASLLVTSLQLAQMMCGLIVSVVVYSVQTSGKRCVATDAALQAGFIMYLSYAVLFAHFFYCNYIHQPTKSFRLKED